MPDQLEKRMAIQLTVFAVLGVACVVLRQVLYLPRWAGVISLLGFTIGVLGMLWTVVRRGW